MPILSDMVSVQHDTMNIAAAIFYIGRGIKISAFFVVLLWKCVCVCTVRESRELNSIVIETLAQQTESIGDYMLFAFINFNQ